MKIYIFLVGIVLIIAAGYAFAAQNSIDSITYPVQELGGCKNQADCRAYCDADGHAKECLDFAEKNNLLPKEEIDRGRKLLSMGKTTGPGGCKGDACETYCGEPSHMKDCIQFAKDNGILQGQELEEAEKVLTYQEKGGVLPDCSPDQGSGESKHGPKGKTPCSQWCAQSTENAKVCFKMSKIMGEGDLPPDMTEEQFAKMMEITGGKKMDCENSQDEAMQQQCEEVGQKMFDAGLMPKKDLEKIKEGTIQMRDSISDPNLPPEVVKCFEEKLGADLVAKIKSGADFMPSRKMGDAMGECWNQGGGPQGPNGGSGPDWDKMPQDVKDCLKNIGINGPDDLKKLTPETGKKSKECFKNMPQGPKDQQGPPCKSPEECKAFCEQNPDRCENGYPKFDEKSGGQGPACRTPEECCIQDPSKCPMDEGPKPFPEGQKQTGPGGCQSEAECQAYCSAHPQECGAPAPGTMMHQCEGSECDSWHAEGQGGPMPGPSDTTGPQMPQPPINQSAPMPNPPDSPLSKIINTDSLVGSLLNLVFKAIFSR